MTRPLKFPTPNPDIDPDTLRGALETANLPALLLVLFQLTGDERWIEPPYLPSRRFAMDPNDSGGFSEDTQRKIKTAAFDAIMAWSKGRAPAVPSPSGELLVRLMSTIAAEPVPADYGPMFGEQMGFSKRPSRAPAGGNAKDFRVVVIGAGLGGLMTGIKLKQAGIPFVILEKATSAGGCWWDNGYPGCGVDTPSYLYTFSFFQRNWSRYFARREEILKYIGEIVSEYGLAPHIRYGVEVKSATYDEAACRWRVDAVDSSGTALKFDGNALVSAVGIFSQPKMPDIAGLDRFKGSHFHTARWPANLDIKGKRVALVGSGASAMQILPKIVDEAASVTVYQRSPAWVIPVSNYFDAVPAGTHWLNEHVPFYLVWYRFTLSWTFNDKLHPTLQIDPNWEHQDRSISAVNDRHRKAFTAYLEEQLGDRPDLFAKCLPKYPPWGKRMLIDNGWYAALKRPHVELVTEGVSALTETGVVTQSGAERPADIVAFSTGFESTRYLFPMTIKGIGGRDLREDWQDDDARAYLGITAPGYPNLFIVYGPNTNGSGGSFLAWSESQVDYIAQILANMIRDGISAVDARKDLHDDYNRRVDAAHARMIWTHPGFSTYYRNSKGRVVVSVPWRVVDYWQMLREARMDDFILTRPSGTDVKAGRVA
jgi:4-hydroxyacetophenone monooxygenase